MEARNLTVKEMISELQQMPQGAMTSCAGLWLDTEQYEFVGTPDHIITIYPNAKVVD